MSRILFLLIFFVSPNFGKLIFTNPRFDTQSSAKFKATTEIINKCYPNDIRGKLIVGDFDDYHNELFTNLQPVIIIRNGPIKNVDKKNKLQIFIVSEKFNLTKNIEFVKNSTWWNHEGFFIIISDENNCKKASNALKIIWKMDILAGFYICNNAKGDVGIFTFNPFSTLAPKPWKKVKNINQSSGDVGSVHRQKYSSSKSI